MPNLIVALVAVAWLFVVTLGYYVVHTPFSADNGLAMLNVLGNVLTVALLSLSRRASVIDGIVNLESNGPIYGNVVPSGASIVGTDLLAVDATCSRLMGFEPGQIDYLDFAAWAGVGIIDESKIEIMGEPLAHLRRNFARPPQLG